MAAKITLQGFKTMLDAVINVGWWHEGTNITDNLREKAKDEKHVAWFYNRCKWFSDVRNISLHDAIYHQLHRGEF